MNRSERLLPLLLEEFKSNQEAMNHMEVLAAYEIALDALQAAEERAEQAEAQIKHFKEIFTAELLDEILTDDVLFEFSDGDAKKFEGGYTSNLEAICIPEDKKLIDKAFANVVKAIQQALAPEEKP